MPRIILSLALIAVVIGVLTYAGTNAFFTDTESSVANVFTAGAIDLKVDNESYYNGVLNPETTWDLVDLTVQKFFNFLDLKPDDYGEDTISLHVDTNDAFLCANVKLTSNDDNGINEPESLVDTTDGAGNGELGGLVNFIWWADDGDNVLENNETVISQGNFAQLGVGNSYPIALADSDQNVWTNGSGPVAGDTTKYLGKAWCFGTIGTAPIAQDGSGSLMTPAGNNDGINGAGKPEDGGITCNGTSLGNESQTDSLTADVSFNAVQARHNEGFQCEIPHVACEINEHLTLIPDSGFENPVVTDSGKWDIFPEGLSGAWHVEWRDPLTNTFGDQVRPILANLEIHRGVVGTPAEGQQYAELDSDWGGPHGSGDGEPASTIIYQDIPTVIGQNYRIEFKFAPRPNTDASENRLEVKWGGTSVLDTGNVAGGGGDIAWQEKVINVTATSNLTRLSFADLGTSDSLGTFVDDFRLYTEDCTIPQP